MPADTSHLPADPASTTALAARGLRMAAVDAADDAAVRAWVEADARGFHDGAPTDEFLAELRGDFALQRTIGVFDDALADPETPIATIAAWPAPVTLPGAEVDAWAISAVTVAPTHRRRGIATAMLEGELRTAADAGIPVAILTVSEATIYGRYGFGPVTWSSKFEADVRRAGWVGADTPGRVQLVGRDTAMATGRTLFDEARRATPGDVGLVGHRFDRLFGAPSDPAEQRKRRFVRYDDEAGTPRGLAIYHVTEDPHDWSAQVVEVDYLATTTDDAYRALWRYLFELDLVGTLRASLRSVDEPLRWLVQNPRMIRTTELREHLWARVLDAPAVLGARTYGGAGRLTLRVDDPLGFADGVFTVETDAEGRAVVSKTEAPDGALLEVPVDLLAPLLFGGVSAATLVAAGRLRERAAGDAATADRLLRAAHPPVLTTWF
ncbi:GNAT family N-acetyltransferase [Microbacterium sp. P06]|uniref:GNAT family N-acetyltransferase n=1 Tax=unclassified Microbacterium TaxID=2609290 RepID=UPI003745A7C5